MYVTIVAKEYEKHPKYNGVELKVPATRETVQDAMERARVQWPGKYRMITFRDWPAFLRERLARMDADVREVSFLAGRIGQMDQEDLFRYEGLLSCVEAERGGQCSIKDLINASYSLEYFEFLPGIVRDTDLGENAVDGGLMQILDGLPDEVTALLDLSKVGTCIRKSEKGVFTKEGYCFRLKEGWQEAYDGQRLPEQETEEEAVLSVRIGNRDYPEEEGKWLTLPCDREGIDSVRRTLQAESAGQYRILEVRSIVSALERHISPDEDIEVLNELAEKVDEMGTGELLKYKAVLEFDDWTGAERALWLTDRLECYSLDPKQVCYGDYGVECLEGCCVDSSDPAFRDFPFEEYGRRQYEKIGMKLTAYGSVFVNQMPELFQAGQDSRDQKIGGGPCQTM